MECAGSVYVSNLQQAESALTEVLAVVQVIRSELNTVPGAEETEAPADEAAPAVEAAEVTEAVAEETAAEEVPAEEITEEVETAEEAA